VTCNLGDSPPRDAPPTTSLVEDPDTLDARLVADDPARAGDAVIEMASRRKGPPATSGEALDHLARHLPGTIQLLRESWRSS
jgi:hypothetical protein